MVYSPIRVSKQLFIGKIIDFVRKAPFNGDLAVINVNNFTTDLVISL